MFSVPCSCLPFFDSLTHAVHSLASLHVKSYLNQNLFHMLPYDLSWYETSLSCILQGFNKHFLNIFHEGRCLLCQTMQRNILLLAAASSLCRGFAGGN